MSDIDIGTWLIAYDTRQSGATMPGAPNEQLRAVLDTLGASDTHAEGAAALAGADIKDALEADDDVRQNLPNGQPPDSSPDFIQAFIKAPATGCSTLLDMARSMSKWDPLTPNDPVNVARFKDYVANIDKNPMFHLTMADSVTYDKKTSDWNKAITEIANLFDGISSEDKGKIKDSLVALAEAATSRSDTKQTTNLFCQNTIQANGEDVNVFIYSSSVEFVESSGKSTSKQQKFTIMRVRLEFKVDLWNQVIATEVAKRHFKDLLDWLDRFTTKQGDSPEQLTCFDEE